MSTTTHFRGEINTFLLKKITLSGDMINLTLVLIYKDGTYIFSQSDYLVKIVDINSHTEWQTVQIQISWLLKKPTDLDLNSGCKSRAYWGSMTRVNSP